MIALIRINLSKVKVTCFPNLVGLRPAEDDPIVATRIVARAYELTVANEHAAGRHLNSKCSKSVVVSSLCRNWKLAQGWEGRILAWQSRWLARHADFVVKLEYAL